jgi:hypothetical protein
VASERRRYRRIEGKIVAFVETSFDDDYKYINVHFQDKTCFTLSLRMNVFPHAVGLYDLSSGDSRIIREYIRPKDER